MDCDGGFHEVEKDGKLFLVYHHPKYRPIQTSSGEAARDDHSSQLLFLCPFARNAKEAEVRYHFEKPLILFPVKSSPEYILCKTRTHQDDPSLRSFYNHPVLPLFWCNNKNFDLNSGWCICSNLNFDTDYYFCELHGVEYHKECVESPLKIKHPYHPNHALQLYFRDNDGSIVECLCCTQIATSLVYHCPMCEIYIHPFCAMKSVPFFVEQPKRHDHLLTFFPRQTSLTCNVCGWLRTNYPTYICARCNFVAHIDCMYSPCIIKISRHHHSISYTSSLRSGEWYCGVCRQSIDSDNGAYTCHKCSNYAVHSRCALGKDVWDGKELEGIPEEEDMAQDHGPFIMISEGLILHYLHDHHLQLEIIEVNILYDENKICQACTLPIYEGNFYSCMECDFILHGTCANFPRKIQHTLHPHPLTLKTDTGSSCGYFECNACDRACVGFVYKCPITTCRFYLDLRCASISEPFDYQSHKHPLYLALNPKEKPICQICKIKCLKQLNCIKCNFIVCFKCITLPYKARYKHDKHFLIVLYGEEVSENDWCEVCERDLEDTYTKVFYWCNECYTTFHIECLFGEDPYMKPGGKYYANDGAEVQILGQSNLSRPFCQYCKNRCQSKVFKKGDRIACSRFCGFLIF